MTRQELRGSDDRVTDPYRYAEVRGRVSGTTGGGRAREHVDELAQNYFGKPYPPENIKSERVIIRVTAERMAD